MQKHLATPSRLVRLVSLSVILAVPAAARPRWSATA